MSDYVSETHIYVPQINPQDPAYDPTAPVPPSHDIAYPGWVLREDAEAWADPPAYDRQTTFLPVAPSGPVQEYGLPPFLGLNGRILLILASPVLIAVVLLGLRLLYILQQVRQDGAQTKREILEACQGVASGVDALSSLPAMMKASTVKHLAKAADDSVTAVTWVLINMLEVAHIIIVILIHTWQSFYLCLAQFIIFGSIALVTGAVQEITGGLNSVLPKLGQGVQTDVTAFVGVVNSAVGVLNTALAGAQSVESRVTAGAASVAGKATSVLGGVGNALGSIFHFRREDEIRTGYTDLLGDSVPPAVTATAEFVEATVTNAKTAFATITALPIVPSDVAHLLEARAAVVSVGTISLPDMSPLNNIQIPTQDITNKMNALNQSVPTLSEVYGFIDQQLDRPFNMATNAINSSIGGLKFNTSAVLLNAQVKPSNASQAMCDQLDLSAIDNVVKNVAFWLSIGLYVMLAGIVLYILGMVLIQSRGWRSIITAVQVARREWQHDHPGQQMGVAGMLAVTHYVAAPFFFNLIDKMFKFKGASRDSARWFIAYATHPYVLSLFAFAVVGVLSTTAQILILNYVLKPKYGKNNDLNNAIANSTVGFRQSLTAHSVAFANSVNNEVARVNYVMNDKVFYPVDNVLQTVNDSVTFMANTLDTFVDKTFGNTFLKDSASSFIDCVITNKLRAVSSGLTWLNSTLVMNISGVDQDILMPPPAAMSLLAGNNSAFSVDYVGRLLTSYGKTLEHERLPFLCLLGLWLLVMLIGLFIAWYSATHTHDVDIFPGEEIMPSAPDPAANQAYVNEKPSFDTYEARSRGYDQGISDRSFGNDTDDGRPNYPQDIKKNYDAPAPAITRSRDDDRYSDAYDAQSIYRLRDSLGTAQSQYKPKDIYEKRPW